MTPIVQLIHASFPSEPLPVRSFWLHGERTAGDIPEGLEKRMMMRPWDAVTMADWTMIAHPDSVKAFLHPTAYRYYLPSLLIGALNDIGHIDWALEAILPTGWRRRATGKWWQDFVTSLSPPQRAALAAYPRAIRARLWDSIGPECRHSVDQAEAIWPA
jgi:hypothetical protein